MGKAIGSGSPFGFGQETTFGVAAEPTLWPRLREEGITVEPEYVTSPAMQPGVAGSVSVDRGNARVEVGRAVSGSFSMDVLSRGMEPIFKNLLNSVPGTSLTTAQQGTTAAYLHTFRLGPAEDGSFTLQKLIRDGQHNVVSRHLYPGSKFASGEFTIQDHLLALALEVVSKDEVYSFTPAEPVYIDDARNFADLSAEIRLGGTLLANRVTSPSLKIENTRVGGGPYVGSGGLISDQPKSRVAVTGGLTAVVLEQALLYEAWRNQTPLSYEMYFPGALIEGAYREYVKFILPQIKLGGSTPTIGGPEELTVDVPWQAFNDDAGVPLITIEYMTKDAVIA